MRRRGLEAVAVMLFTCLLCGLTVTSVASVFGPAELSALLFLGGAVGCAFVLVWPDNPSTRAGSGVLVVTAFAWRAVAAVIGDLFYEGNRAVFAVILYTGIAVFLTLTWHRVLPTRRTTRARIEGFGSGS